MCGSLGSKWPSAIEREGYLEPGCLAGSLEGGALKENKDLNNERTAIFGT